MEPIMGKIRIDILKKKLSYRCACGRTIAVPFAEVVAESRDYCGCGGKTISLADPKDIADYRQIAGLPKRDK